MARCLQLGERGSMAAMDGSLQEGLLGGGDAALAKPTGTSWVKIALIIVTNFLGAGVLSLPFAASSLGYLAFLIVLVIVFGLALLSGRSYAMVYRALPDSRAMSDVGRAAFGRRGEVAVGVRRRDRFGSRNVADRSRCGRSSTSTCAACSSSST